MQNTEICNLHELTVLEMKYFTEICWRNIT